MIYQNMEMMDRWKLWRSLMAGAQDTLITSLKSSNFPAAPDSRILPEKVRPDEAMMIRMFGQDADGEGASFRLTGFAHDGKGGRSEGFIIASGAVVLGSKSIDEAPFDLGAVGADAGPWFEVDTYTLTTNAVTAKALTNGANSSTLLVLPTIGFSEIICEITDKDGETGTEMMDLAILYKLIPADLAYQILANVA